ncbi:MAG: hypothetical protein JWO77_1273 [Ilumatobacteraceae bacterium]|nr:hypothetical protein [Ilumatobacteraceae bacterium]
MRRPLSDSELIGGALGAIVALCVAGLMGGFRGEVSHANAALMLALVTLAAATIGGRWAGGATALAGALGFDYFLTRPYDSLAIKDGSEIITTILLLVVGLAVGQIVLERVRAERGKQDGVDEVGGLHRVSRLVADGAPVGDVVAAVETEVAKVLLVPGCAYSLLPPELPHPSMEETGRVDATYVHVEDGFALPPEGIVIPVRGAGAVTGWLVCEPPAHLVGVSPDRRRTALVLASFLGAALTRTGAHAV